DAVAPYFHPRLAWGDVEGEHTFWMARAHKYLLMPQRDLTVGGRAPVTHLLRPARLPAPGTDLTTFAANGGFYFQAFNEMHPLLDKNTAVTGPPVWRDSHPQEWPLASLPLPLHPSGLAPPSPCRSPGALRVPPPRPVSSLSAGTSWKSFHYCCPGGDP